MELCPCSIVFKEETANHVFNVLFHNVHYVITLRESCCLLSNFGSMSVCLLPAISTGSC
jgi:hypothetical protein